MDAFEELIESRFLSKLKDLIKPKFGMKATNVCESINSICRQWLDKSERPRQYVAHMALADFVMPAREPYGFVQMLQLGARRFS
jgi:hypothetical protein